MRSSAGPPQSRPPSPGDDDFVFCHPERGTKIREQWYADEFRKALKTAGITDYIRPFHDVRHASLTNGAAAGKAPIALMTRAGHRSMSTTRGYLHLAGVAFRDEADAPERRLLGGAESDGGVACSKEAAAIDHHRLPS